VLTSVHSNSHLAHHFDASKRLLLPDMSVLEDVCDFVNAVITEKIYDYYGPNLPLKSNLPSVVDTLLF
jgi:hypothetical protein